MAKDKIPNRYLRFQQEYPEIGSAYEALGDAVHKSGPLDKKTRALIKLGISGGAMLEGAFHSHVRKALSAGASPEEIRQVAFLALPTIGFPSMMALQSWADDVLSDE